VYEDPWGVLRGIFQDQFENGNFGDLMAGATLRLKKWPADHYPTASHRIDFDPPDIGIPLPVDAAPLSDAKDGQWVLLNSSLSHYTHSQFQDIYGPLPAIVQIHPADAAACRIGENDSVRLENHQGSVTVTARITDAVPPGVLWCPRPFAGLCGTPLNTLTSAEPQPIGGGSRFNSTRVRIRPVKNDFPSPVDQPA
jgi:anaerobic selenocysteine-containing dehydrogenase